MNIDHKKRRIQITIQDSYIDFTKEKGLKKKHKVTFSVYKKIIAKFLGIWLYSFLWSRGEHYFPFGWTAAKYLFKEKYTKNKFGEVVYVPNRYGILWKPFSNIFYKRIHTARVFKNGNNSSNSVNIEKDWQDNYSKEHLLTLEQEKEAYLKQLKEHRLWVENIPRSRIS